MDGCIIEETLFREAPHFPSFQNNKKWHLLKSSVVATSGFFSPLWNCHAANSVNRGNYLHCWIKAGLGFMCETVFCPLVNQVVHVLLVKLKWGKSKYKSDRRMASNTFSSSLLFTLWWRWDLISSVWFAHLWISWPPASGSFLHLHVNRQLKCWMAFVFVWGPNDTLTVVCMCFPLNLQGPFHSVKKTDYCSVICPFVVHVWHFNTNASLAH